MVEIDNKIPMNIANIMEINWINWYPRPRHITFDGKNENRRDLIKARQEEFNFV